MLNLVHVVGVPNFIFFSFCMWNTYVFIDYCICCNDLGIRPQNAKVKLWPFGLLLLYRFVLLYSVVDLVVL